MSKWIDQMAWIVAGACLCWALSCEAKPVEKVITGHACEIIDGDTFTLIDEEHHKKYRIRLAYVDAPEMRQEYGAMSKMVLDAELMYSNLTVKYTKRDRYRRVVGIVYREECKDVPINDIMLRKGAAWHYAQYDKGSQCEEHRRLEAEAVLTRKGLWSGLSPIAPWEYRRAPKK